jgi:dTMP kinase
MMMAALDPSERSGRRGLMIAVEGGDGVGKTTQAGLLTDWLTEQMQQPAVLVRYPDRTTAIGAVLNQFLKGQLQLDVHASTLLFLSNLWQCHAEVIEPALARGTHVILDRYVASCRVYSELRGVPSDFVQAVMCDLPEPDVTFYLTAPLDIVQRRDAKFGAEIYDTVEHQQRVQELFEREQRLHPDWLIIDAAKSLEDVASELKDMLRTKLFPL